MTELDELPTLSTAVLQQRYQSLFSEPTASRNRLGLIRRIAWRIQERALGGLTERAQQRARELADDAELRRLPPRSTRTSSGTSAGLAANGETRPGSGPSRRDPRLPAVGSSLRRVYRGVVHDVVIGETDFEYAGERFESLSAVAKRITGTHLNGFRFFGLGTRGVA
jgi:hypothetical protein